METLIILLSFTLLFSGLLLVFYHLLSKNKTLNEQLNFQKSENEDKRKQDDLHADMNNRYKMESLKWEVLKTIVVENLPKRKEPAENNGKKDLVEISRPLIEEFKKLKKEIDNV